MNLFKRMFDISEDTTVNIFLVFSTIALSVNEIASFKSKVSLYFSSLRYSI